MRSLGERANKSVKISILNALLHARARGYSSGEVAKNLGITPQLANYHLLRLARENLVAKIEGRRVKRDIPHVRFVLAPAGKQFLDELLLNLAGMGQEPEETASMVDLDFQNLQTLFRQFTDAVKPLVPATQWEIFNFLRAAIVEEIDKLRQTMKIRVVGNA
jgi:predicted ArsR family transcriptional regulator